MNFLDRTKIKVDFKPSRMFALSRPQADGTFRDGAHLSPDSALKIFRCLNKNTLNVREVAVLTEFYRERLKDVWQIHGAVMEGRVPRTP